jgi:hypothetical protein
LRKEKTIVSEAIAVSPYLTAIEAARYIRKSISWLALMRMQNAGPKFYLSGTRVVYRVADLDAYVVSPKPPRTGSPNAGRPPTKNRRGSRK